MTIAYVESSGLAKLAMTEPGTEALRSVLMNPDIARVTSALTYVEVQRAAWRAGDDALAKARTALLSFNSIPVDQAVLERAARLAPPELRSLDAIHIATALAIDASDLVFFSYDPRTLAAAALHGLTVSSPGA